MTVRIAPAARQQFLNASGDPYVGAKLFTYLAGTTTKQATYTTSAGGTANSNPVILDASGRTPSGIWLTEGVDYKFVLAPSTDTDPPASPIYTEDYIEGVNDATTTVTGLALKVATADLAASTGSSLAGHISLGTGAVARTVQSKLREVVSVLDFGADQTGVADSGPMIQLAVNYAGTIATSIGTTSGVGVYFPDGLYLVDTEVTIPDTCDGVVFYGSPGKGALLKTSLATITMFNVGDNTHANPTYRTTFRNLNFAATDNAATATTAIAFHRTPESKVVDCLFWDFNIAIDGYRWNQSVCSGNSFYNSNRTAAADAVIRLQGVASGETGGGLHFTDNEFTGNPDFPEYLPAQILVHTVDGLYITQCHFANQTEAIRFEPLGTAANNTITDVMVQNCYFDNPATVGTSYNVRFTGTVDSGGALGSGYYQNITFANCLFRGASVVANCVKIDIADGAAFASAGRKVQNISFVGGTMKQSTDAAVLVLGNTNTKLEVYGLKFDSVYFLGNNTGGAATNSGIQAEVETLLIADCIFDAESVAATKVIQATLTSSPSGYPVFTCTGNDLTRSLSLGTAATPAINYSAIATAGVVVSDNILPGGPSQQVDQVYTTTTTNATPKDIWNFVIPDFAAGYAEIELSGSSADGAKAVTYSWRVGFRRSGTSSLNTGTSAMAPIIAWNPDTITAPTATLSGNTLVVNITGVAATTMTWACRAVVSMCK